MLPIETVLPFFAASLLLALSPGPDNLFVLTQSAMHGAAAGLLVMLGLCTGLVGHSMAVAFGVAVIFQTSAIAFLILKGVGAIYLVYLAILAFRARPHASCAADGAAVERRKLYTRGIIMNITNPKVSIFFLAFLPQFADPSRGSLSAQLLMLGGLFIVSTIVVFGAIALLAGSLGNMLNRSRRVQLAMSKVAGMVFLGLAVKLAVTAR